jgi:hypothetical protein
MYDFTNLSDTEVNHEDKDIKCQCHDFVQRKKETKR